MHETTLGAARAAYWQVNHFGDDGGDALEWVPTKVWKLTLEVPNTDGRRRAVRLHDLHHVLTGYQTTWTGEAEIAAWELASGCFRWPAATVLNTGALAVGLVIAPLRVARAWSRGRQTENLYGEDGVDHLLPCSVDGVRTTLDLDRPGVTTRFRDVALLAGLVLAPIAAIRRADPRSRLTCDDGGMIRWVAIVSLICACYHGEDAARDINAAWRGRARAEIEGTWGTPAVSSASAAAWTFTTTHVELPAGAAAISITPTRIDVSAAGRAGEIWKTDTTATATFDPDARIGEVRGPPLHWGAPRGANLRWGTVFGVHAGLGRLDQTSTPLPSGGLYIGGMLGPRLGLVGTFSMVTGDAGSAIGFGWGMGLSYWPLTRVAVRAGPAFVLAFDLQRPLSAAKSRNV